jgi:hypothetical protein
MYVPSHCTYSSYLSYNAYFVYFIYDIDVVHWLQRNLMMDSKSTTGMLQIDICGTEQGSAGHCVSSSFQQQPGSHFHLLHPPDWAYKTSGSNASIIMAVFAEEIAADQILTNRQDMIFIRPPGISDGAFQLRMDNIWFCKLLLLFKINTMTDTGMQQHECAYVSALEEYKGPLKSGHILHILHILRI